MKLASKIKKISAVALMGSVLIAFAGTLSVHAQTIDQVSVSKPGYGITSTNDGSGVNVRNAPSLEDSDIIVSIPNGTRLMIVGQSDDFYKVQYDAHGHYGYVSKTYLKFQPSSMYLVANTDGSNLNMRSGPSTSYSRITSIPNGTAFAYYGSATNGWYSGIYGNATGFTSVDYTLLKSY